MLRVLQAKHNKEKLGEVEKMVKKCAGKDDKWAKLFGLLAKKYEVPNPLGMAGSASAGAGGEGGVRRAQELAGEKVEGEKKAKKKEVDYTKYEMDDLYYMAVVQALLLTVKDEQLPLLASTFVAKNMTPCR
jgi:hypothetical protein